MRTVKLGELAENVESAEKLFSRGESIALVESQ